MGIGNNIKVKRGEKGLSQEVLAEKLHVSQVTLSNIDAGKSIPEVILLRQIAEVREPIENKKTYQNFNSDRSFCLKSKSEAI